MSHPSHPFSTVSAHPRSGRGSGRDLHATSGNWLSTSRGRFARDEFQAMQVHRRPGHFSYSPAPENREALCYLFRRPRRHAASFLIILSILTRSAFQTVTMPACAFPSMANGRTRRLEARAPALGFVYVWMLRLSCTARRVGMRIVISAPSAPRLRFKKPLAENI